MRNNVNTFGPNQVHDSIMKTSLRLLTFAAASGLALSSCVVDPYGYPVAGVGYPAATYSSVSYYGAAPYYNDGYGYTSGYGYNAGYSPYYAPVSTSFAFFGGRSYGNNCYRPGYSSGGHHRGSSHSYQRPVSSSQHYASQVTRPSTFRGNSVFSSPPLSPSISAPRTLPRPTSRSFPSPTRTYNAPSISPGQNSAPPSQPSPSGRFERISPGPSVAGLSAPSSSRNTMSTVSSPSGRFGGLPSDMRRSR